MLSFLRSDLAQLQAYTPHPGGEVTQPLDHLDTNESPYDLPADLKGELTALFRETIASNRYPDGSHHDLKMAIAHYLDPKGGIAPDRLTVGNGSDELIRSVLIATCLNGAGEILVADPTFSMYGILAQSLGIPVHHCGRDPETFALDLVQAQDLIEQNPAIRVVWLVHPNSPTGNALSEAELHWVRSLDPRILVVIDEAYYEFSRQTVVPELADRPHWLVMRTFSKAFRLAALRVGYGVGDPALIQALEKLRLPYNLPSFSQAGALLALKHAPTLLATVEETIAERDRLYQSLLATCDLRLWPSAANFLYGRLPGETMAQQDRLKTLVNQLKAQGTLIRHTGLGLRITVGSPAENQRTLQRLAHLCPPS